MTKKTAKKKRTITTLIRGPVDRLVDKLVTWIWARVVARIQLTLDESEDDGVELLNVLQIEIDQQAAAGSEAEVS